MDIYVELIRKRIKEKYKTIEQFSKFIGIPRTTINFILKNGIGSSNYNMVMKLLKALDISCVDNTPIINDTELKNLIKMYCTLDDLGKHAVCSVAETEFRRIERKQDKDLISAAYGSISGGNTFTDEEIQILTLMKKIKGKQNDKICQTDCEKTDSEK